MKPTTNETQALIDEARNGSREAFVELVRRHQMAIRQRLRRYLGFRHEAVDDVAQEVFVVAFRDLSKFEGTGSFEAWLNSIARHQAIDLLRRESRYHREDGYQLEATLLDWRVTRLESDSFVDADMEGALARCLEKLSDSHRVLVERFYYDGDSCETIAVDRRVNAGSVRMMLFRVRRALEKCIRRHIPSLEIDDE